MTKDERDTTQQFSQHPPETGSGQRGRDDRRTGVRPSDSPVPSSPEADHDAVRKGQETWERVKPY